MARPQAFERELKIALANVGLSPDAQQKRFVAFAKQELAKVQAEGIFPRQYEKIVNGRLGAAEESVQLPGPILYLGNPLGDVEEFCLVFGPERSPVRSGRYKRSFFSMVNGARHVHGTPIPRDAELIISNDVPYSRRIEVGKTESGRPFVIRVPPGIFQDMKQAVMRRFGNIITAQVRFIPLSGGYTLKGDKGRQLLYPALAVDLNF